jgi:hypothetical protein
MKLRPSGSATAYRKTGGRALLSHVVERATTGCAAHEWLTPEIRCLLISAGFTTAWPYMDNEVEPPLLPDVTTKPAVNNPDLFKIPRKRVRQKWRGDL